MDAAEALGLLRVTEIVEGPDGFPGVRSTGTDVDAPRIAEAPKVPVREDMIVLVEHERSRHRVVRQEPGVAVADADDLVACPEKRGRGSADDGIRARGGAAREEDGDAGKTHRRRGSLGRRTRHAGQEWRVGGVASGRAPPSQ